MWSRARGWMRLTLVALLALIAPGGTSRAQNWGGPWTNLTAGGIFPMPAPPPQGTFGEVIFANPRWVVVQNQQGQQFPIAVDSIGQFLIRWQAGVGDLSPNVLVEAIGPEQGSMTIATDHIDVFKGSDQTLVAPGYVSVLPIRRPVTAIDPTYQRWMNGYDIAAQNTLYAWVFPIAPGNTGIPSAMHAVGNPVQAAPLVLGVTGNNFATILPSSPAGYSITQVTMGSPTFARKGDFAFLLPVQGQNPVGERSLVLGKLVLYKRMRREQFVP